MFFPKTIRASVCGVLAAAGAPDVSGFKLRMNADVQKARIQACHDWSWKLLKDFDEKDVEFFLETALGGKGNLFEKYMDALKSLQPESGSDEQPKVKGVDLVKLRDDFRDLKADRVENSGKTNEELQEACVSVKTCMEKCGGLKLAPMILLETLMALYEKED